MNVFIVNAHPEPKSLNQALTTVAVDTLTESGRPLHIGRPRVAHSCEVAGLSEQRLRLVP